MTMNLEEFSNLIDSQRLIYSNRNHGNLITSALEASKNAVFVRPGDPMFTSGGLVSHTNEYLPESYKIGDNTVVCGRGSACFNHLGNKKFRQLIESRLEQYANALTKFGKTILIHEVVNAVRNDDPTGIGFVKKDTESGRYYKVSDYQAKEKTSQAFRDSLTERYKYFRTKLNSNQKRLIRNASSCGQFHCIASAPTMLHLQTMTSDLHHAPNKSMINATFSLDSREANIPFASCKLSSVISNCKNTEKGHSSESVKDLNRHLFQDSFPLDREYNVYNTNLLQRSNCDDFTQSFNDSGIADMLENVDWNRLMEEDAGNEVFSKRQSCPTLTLNNDNEKLNSRILHMESNNMYNYPWTNFIQNQDLKQPLSIKADEIRNADSATVSKQHSETVQKSANTTNISNIESVSMNHFNTSVIACGKQNALLARWHQNKSEGSSSIVNDGTPNNGNFDKTSLRAPYHSVPLHSTEFITTDCQSTTMDQINTAASDDHGYEDESLFKDLMIITDLLTDLCEGVSTSIVSNSGDPLEPRPLE